MPTNGTTLRETAYQKIKSSIVNGEWEGGTFLSEKQLSERLQMSKTPIRSALDRLEMMGLVKLVPNQGFVVQELSLKKIMDIYELRLSLETFAANHLTGKMDRLFFDKLDANLALQADAVESEDIVKYVELDRQFHECIISGMANEEYADAMSRIHDKFLIAVRTTFYKNKKRLSSSLNEHKQIRHALEGNDPAATVALVKKHIEFVEQIML
ncbi:GntR family transcriptional regulator [Cohnella abietis]|uniref:GntR family transcriptional regulator n=1 Tax=Cohnella abietis TaxID=2507935 RepID=A0A3T1D4C6_9BACL|nr:GntR family transcriptional regulator [Cohnella abietis]BBI32954.1 GntR family transcriptional regulator [Cohnella abietis]